jgi:predicted DNA-binding transcriptional regulator YafY
VKAPERVTDLLAMLLHARRPLRLDEILGDIDGYPDDRDSARVQFERDKAMLRDLGADVIVSGSGDDTGYRVDPSTYELPDLGLTGDEALALNLAVTAVRVEGIDVTGAVWKLGLDPDTSPPLVAIPTLPALPVLQAAAAARALAAFRYNGVDRVVEPYGLLTREGWWYVVGHDRTRAALRVFRVDRLESDVSVGDARAFDVPDGFDIETAVAGLAFELAPGEGVEARVWVDAEAAERVVADVGEGRVAERRGDGSIVVALRVTHPGGFLSWVFGLLEHAVVLDPPALVDEVVGRLRAMA